MAWRFHVQLDGSNASKSRLAASILPSVITNFILDTGSKDTYVPPVALAALGYRGNMNRTFLKTLQSIHACITYSSFSGNRGHIARPERQDEMHRRTPGRCRTGRPVVHDRWVSNLLLRRWPRCTCALR
jgi:hypothetical protein